MTLQGGILVVSVRQLTWILNPQLAGVPTAWYPVTCRICELVLTHTYAEHAYVVIGSLLRRQWVCSGAVT